MGSSLSTIVVWSVYIVTVLAIGAISIFLFPFKVALFNAFVLGFIAYLITLVAIDVNSNLENILLGIFATLAAVSVYGFMMIRQLGI